MLYDSASERIAVDCEFRFQVYEKDGWSVIKYKSTDGKDFTACGKNLPTVKSTGYRLYGRWERTEKFGLQFEVEFYEELLPTNSKGFVAYMKSLKCGIGGIKARLIYDKFGENVWTIIERDPMQLTTVTGITEKSVQRLMSALRSTHLLKDVMMLFQGKVEITPAKANLLIEKFGNNTMDVIKKYPYKLCSVQGFSFPMVDRMGLSLGKSPADTERLIALIDYTFELSGATGNICVPYKEYIDQLERYANMGFPNRPVPREECIRVLKMQIKGGRVVYTAGMLYAEYRAFEEKESVSDLKRLMARPQKKDPKQVEKLISEYEKENNIQLADSQKDAIRMVFSNPVSIITGGPGTGKTTIIKAILYLHKKLYETSSPMLLAPTAKAARRITEQSGVDATTVHSAIGYTGAEDIRMLKEQDKNILAGNLIIVDEVSMLDQFIYTGLLMKIQTGSKLVMVGDPDQLPSVGAGEVLYQLIRSQTVPVTKLSVIFRQSAENPIVYNAAQINAGNAFLPLINQSIHTLDLLSYIGGPIEKVRGAVFTGLLEGRIEVEDNAMAVVNDFNADYPLEFYHFFRDNGCEYLQLSPIVERIAVHADGRHLADLNDAEDSPLADFSLTPKQWGEFLCAIFDEWVRNDVGRFYVETFDCMLANWAGQDPGICIYGKECGHAGVMEFNGDVYSCDHFVFPEYRLGNISRQSLTTMMYSEQQQAFGRMKQASLPRQCRECRFLFACHGECPRNRFLRDVYQEPFLNYLCAGYRQFFCHVAADMDYMKTELDAGRPPSGIMAQKRHSASGL